MAPFRIERYVVKSFLDAMKSILDKVTYIVGCFAGLLIFCCGMMIAYEVVCRSVFNAPTEWVMELATYCVTVAGFLGMSVTYAAKKHIHVDLLLTKLSKSTCDKLEIVTTLVGAFYSFIFMVKGAHGAFPRPGGTGQADNQWFAQREISSNPAARISRL